MSRSLPFAKHLSHDELIEGYRSCRDLRDRRRWEVLIWYSRALDVRSISARLGLSVPWVRHIIRRYNEEGPEALIDRRPQHPGPSSLLDEEQMQLLLAAVVGRSGRRGAARVGSRPVEWPQSRGLDERTVGAQCASAAGPRLSSQSGLQLSNTTPSSQKKRSG